MENRCECERGTEERERTEGVQNIQNQAERTHETDEFFWPFFWPSKNDENTKYKCFSLIYWLHTDPWVAHHIIQPTVSLKHQPPNSKARHAYQRDRSNCINLAHKNLSASSAAEGAKIAAVIIFQQSGILLVK